MVLGLIDDDIFMSQAKTKNSSIVNTLNYFNYGKIMYMSDSCIQDKQTLETQKYYLVSSREKLTAVIVIIIIMV
jgi:hypothetical protein